MGLNGSSRPAFSSLVLTMATKANGGWWFSSWRWCNRTWKGGLGFRPCVCTYNDTVNEVVNDNKLFDGRPRGGGMHDEGGLESLYNCRRKANLRSDSMAFVVVNKFLPMSKECQGTRRILFKYWNLSVYVGFEA